MSATSRPERIGDYAIERELGRGAHGVVYRAHHSDRPKTPIALKVIEGRGNLDRLLVEPAILSRLDHPGIVGIEDYFLQGEDLILALEFLDGDDLKTLLDDGEPFDSADVREMLVQLAGALAEAHAKDVIHRDVKPSNILVIDKGGRRRYVLTDFGIGQVAEGIQVKKHTGGTYFFMAPEQLRGRPGPQSDLWALGVVAYRLLTGRLPFPGPTLGELSQQILYSAVVPPSQLSANPIDPQLEAVVLRLLDKSLQERYASAKEVLHELGESQRKARSENRRSAKSAERNSLDRNLRLGILKRRIWIALCVLVYLVPSGLISAALMLAGMILFALGQGKRGSFGRNALLTGSAIVLLMSHAAFRFFLSAQYDISVGGLFLSFLVWLAPGIAEPLARIGPTFAIVLGIVLAALLIVLYVTWLFLAPITGAIYASLRRLQREQLLRTAAQEGGAGSDRYLSALRQALDSRFEDVSFHLRYAEALFARGQTKESAVECRLLLRQDPYNFNGNLLLANAYYTLGLTDECVAVCDNYLAVSGYCFEFSELREQCLRRLVPQ